MAIKIVTGDDFEPIEEGVWDADLTHMEERNEMNGYTKQMEDVIKIEFTIIEGDMKDRKAFVTVTPKIGQKTKLFAVCKGIMKREFTAEELAEIAKGDLPALVKFIGGKPVRLVVKHRVSARGNTYYVVSDYMKSPRDEGIHEYVAERQTADEPPHPAEEEDNETVKAAKEVFGEEEPKAEAQSFDDVAKELDSDKDEKVTKATPKAKV